jgi:hypothetical protein
MENANRSHAPSSPGPAYRASTSDTVDQSLIVKRAATHFSKAMLRTRTIPRSSGGRAPARGEMDSRQMKECGGVCDEGIGDKSVILRSGAVAVSPIAAFARTRHWEDEKDNTSFDSASGSVSESGLRRADGRSVAWKKQMDSNPSSPPLKRTLFRLDNGRASLRTLGWVGAAFSLQRPKEPVLGHPMEDFNDLRMGKVIGAGVRVTGEVSLYREDKEGRTEISLSPT